MSYTDVIRERRSIRKFKADAEVKSEDIQKMLEAAMMAPSACNTRPWEFFVVRDVELKEKIRACSPYMKMVQAAPVAIVVCGRPDLQDGVCNPYWPQDCGAAIQNILLQAKDLGYGTCWCGCYPNQERVDSIQPLLNTASIPVAVIAVGVADEAPAARGYFDESRVTYL